MEVYMPSTKSIYLSYADEDESVATQLNSALDILLDGQAFFRRFDLRAGASLYEVIDDAVSTAKWFILILSSKSIHSNWIKRDAKLQTIRWLQQINCNIIVLKIDEINDYDIPKHLRIALEAQYAVNLYESQDVQGEFIEIANHILKDTSYEAQQDLFVDRGDSVDRFAYTSRNHPIMFILGMAGIGKTAFVINKVSKELAKQPIRIKLMPGMGNSIDYIARQVLKEAFVEQPISNNVDEQTLVMMAVEAVKKRNKRYFLFVDNLEYSLNVSNELDEKFIEFLQLLINNDFRSHVVLATTRMPQYPIDFASYCDILRLDELDDLYIQQCIDEWLSDYPRRKDIMSSTSMPFLIKAAGGLPLAAQLLVSSLKAGISPDRIISSDEPKRIKLRLAAKILGTMQSVLTEAEENILQVLAFYNEYVSVEDLMELDTISRFGIERVNNAILNLNKYLLIKENDDGHLSLHTFLTSYYREQLSREDGDNVKQSSLANEIASYTLMKTNALYNELQSLGEDSSAENISIKSQLTSEILRYAVPANKFLRITNNHDDADNLPIKIKGVVRDLVLYFYRDAKDYHNAIKYADRWLRIFPKDYEILLYKARALRNLGQENQLKEAQEILSKIDDVTRSRFFNDRVANERGKISSQKGDDNTARAIYVSSIKNGTTFPETYVNLARIYLKDSKSLPEHKHAEKQALAKESIILLEKANSVSRSASDIFEQFFFDVYIEALEVIEDDSAFGLLEDALEEKPNDRRLNFRMAEILRERGEFEEAKEYAFTAVKNDSISAYITLANIFCAEGRLFLESNDASRANSKFSEAKKYTEKFKSRSPYSQYEVADSILAKIYRYWGDWENAEKILAPHEKSIDRYIVYEYAELLFHKASQKISNNQDSEALGILNDAVARLSRSNITSRDYMLLKEKIINLIDKYKSA